LASIVDQGLTVHVPSNDVIAQRRKPTSRKLHVPQGATICSDFVPMSGVMAAFVVADEALEPTRRSCVTAVIDDLRSPCRAIVRCFGKEAPWMAHARADDFLHGLTLPGQFIHAETGPMRNRCDTEREG
jgi:hypothetical protein